MARTINGPCGCFPFVSLWDNKHTFVHPRWGGQLLEAVKACLEPSTYRLAVRRSGVPIVWSHNFMPVDSLKAFFYNTSGNEFEPSMTFTHFVMGKRMGQVAALSPTGLGSDRRAFQGELADVLIPVC